MFFQRVIDMRSIDLLSFGSLNIDKQQQAEALKGTLDTLLLQGTNDIDLGGHTALLNYLRTPCLPR